MQTSIEVRCPSGPQRLLAKVLASGDKPTYTDDNLIEFVCVDCRRLMRKKGATVTIVLHRYNILGEHVETLVR